MVVTKFALFAACLLVVTPLISAQGTLDSNLLYQVGSLQTTDATIDASQATVQGSGLRFNTDGTISVVVNGGQLFTIPGVNLNGTPAPESPPEDSTAPGPEASKATQLQVVATNLPGLLSGVLSIKGPGEPYGRKMKL